MKFLPSVVQADHRGDFRLHVVFNDGSENTIDFAPWLDGPMFESLKAPEFFARFFIDGGTVVWPNQADIAPETLYAVAGRRRPSRHLKSAKTVERQATRRPARAFAAEAAWCASRPPLRGSSTEPPFLDGGG